MKPPPPPPDNVTPNLADQLRAFRLRHGFTQAAAAAACHIAPKTWEAWEQNVRVPRASMRAALTTVMATVDNASANAPASATNAAPATGNANLNHAQHHETL